MPKAKVARQRHNPLHVAIEEGSGTLRTKSRAKRQGPDVDDDNEEAYLDAVASRKILDLARKQREEIDEEEAESAERTAIREPTVDIFEEDDDEVVGGDEAWEDEEDYGEYADLDVDVDPEEEAIFQRYIEEQDDEEPVSLSDKIMAKVRELEMKESGIAPQPDAGGVMLPPKVIEVYTQVGELLSRFRSGRVPRAFKIIPTLKNWRDVLYVTQPETWSNQAVYEGAKLFVSNLTSGQAQKFVRDVLLERFRDQVRESKTVNYHLYRALKKSLYKPAAFFKGFLFPLIESGTCSLREATIASSILARVSVPALHSAAALLHLAEMSYSGPNSLFIRVLLDKKYALPYKVVDAMVFHFLRFKQHEEQLPVIWHQSLLAFAQRYRNDITEDQRDVLLMVLRQQNHPSITPEIRRELLAGTPRAPDVTMHTES